MEHNRFNKRDNSYLKYKKELYEEMNGRCAYCGCELDYKKATIDHKVPLAVGGTNERENLIICCFSCNHYKRNRDIEGFRESIKNTVKWLKGNSAYRLALKYGRISETNIDERIMFFYEHSFFVCIAKQYCGLCDYRNKKKKFCHLYSRTLEKEDGLYKRCEECKKEYGFDTKCFRKYVYSEKYTREEWELLGKGVLLERLLGKE